MSKKTKNSRLERLKNQNPDTAENDGFSVESGKKSKSTATRSAEDSGKKGLKRARSAIDSDGLSVERRVGKREKKHESVIKLPSINYTKKVRRAASHHGDTVFFVNGKNGVRVLGALSKICSVRNVNISADGVAFEVKSKHRGQIIAILNNLCYDYKIIKSKGAFPFAINTLGRLGFVVGIVLIVAMIAIFSQFVTRVSVTSADVHTGDIDNALNVKITDILSSYGVRAGRWLPSLDPGEVEKDILALDGVSYASVRRHGTHISVTIKREQPSDVILGVSGSHVVAKKVAVVTRVIVEGGTAAVEYGDVVRAGDTLIDGYVVFGEDKLEVEAKGIVYGKVFYKKTVFFENTVRERIKGDVKRVTKLGMFGKIPKAPESPFENCEVQTSVSELGFLLPFRIYTYEFREITESEHENTLSVDEMYDRVYSQIVAELKEPSKVLNRYHEISETADGRYVTVTVEAEERIS